MGLVLLLLFLIVPIVEIAVFIQVGDWIGLWPTLGLIVLTALLGSWQLRLQGMATLARARQQLDRGEIPARELFDGMCLLGAGALLLTPGFVTDLAGASLFLPPVRGWLRRTFGRHLVAKAQAGGPAGARTRVFVNGEEVDPGSARGTGAGPHADPRSRWGRRGAPPGTIEGEWTDVSEAPPGASDSPSGAPRPDDTADDTAPETRELPRGDRPGSDDDDDDTPGNQRR